MAKALALIVLVIYTLCLLFIFFYSLVQAKLAFLYIKTNKVRQETEQPKLPEEIPFVTIQLPIFNELYVVERLIDQFVDLDYPKDKFEIQVLDDSTDETVDIIARKVTEVKEQGIDIKQIRRKERVGYKAGALEYGLNIAKGEFIAIFDADFLPEGDFLRKTIPHFYKDPKIAVVQTRWQHINADYSLLTKLQAFGLDAHFTVEQMGRNTGNHFINFNGTAGIWRKESIVDSGGWQHDTITEDLDLSYRAQLKGWRFVYLEEVGTPSELPVAMSALKTQQYRWTKGAAECTRKNLWNVLKRKNLGFGTKIHAFFHLLNSFIFICVLVSALLSVPLLYIKNSTPELSNLFNYATFFLISFLCLSLFYWVSRPIAKGKFTSFLGRFPLFLSVSMGLSLHNGIAVIEGYIGRKTPFVRTPKFNLQKTDGNWSANKYLRSSLNLVTVLEIVLVFYFAFGIWSAFILNDFGLMPFHIMLLIGFSVVSYYSIFHSALRKG